MTIAAENNTQALQRRQALRQHCLAARQAVAPETRAAWSAALVQQLRAHFTPPARVAFCWPYKGEPDVLALMAEWRASGSRIALPVVPETPGPLAFREWLPEATLQPDRYGIPYPPDGTPLVPEVLLLPLNAFDAAGYRIGYGGGYFDRTLAALQPRPVVVGLGFELGRVASTEPQPHDQPVDWLVTEAGVWPCAGGVAPLPAWPAGSRS